MENNKIMLLAGIFLLALAVLSGNALATDFDGDGFNSTATGGLDCNDSNFNIIPFNNSQTNNINRSVTICLGTYTNPTVTITANNIILNLNGSTIQGLNSGTGITLSSKTNVTIENGYVTKYLTGIFIATSNSNRIINVSSSTNADIGIKLQSSSSNNLTNLTLNSNGNGQGLTLITSSSNRITDIIANNNGLGKGILISGSSNVLTNTTTNSNNVGIELSNNGNNIIQNSTIKSNTNYGINFIGTPTNVNLSNNKITLNNIGIQLTSGSGANISNNNISSNTNIGLNVAGSNNLFFNNFLSNPINVFDNGTNNKWNTSLTTATNIIGGEKIGGNFYSDYTGTDGSRPPDGIGDTSFTIAGTSGAIDFLPLTNNLTPLATGLSALIIAILPVFVALGLIIFLVNFMGKTDFDSIQLFMGITIGIIILVVIWNIIQNVIT